MIKPSACDAVECLQQRLQHEPSSVRVGESRTQKSCHTAKSTASTSCFALSRLSSVKFGLLATLLLIVLAASWPTGTSAAPRKARGAHLILPHPNKPTKAAPGRATLNQQRLHCVKGGRRHHHAEEAIKDTSLVLYMPQVKDASSCKAMQVNKTKVDKLQEALDTAQRFKDTVICTTEDWLYNFYNKSNIVQENTCFHLHKLELEHPLQDRVSKVHVTSEGKFLYEGPVGPIEDEMPKIIETLLVLEKMLKNITYDSGHYECTFRHIKDAVQNNINTALNLMNDQQCNTKEEIHYRDTIRKPFFVAMETIKVLTILEYTYEKLINSQMTVKG